MRAKNHDQRKGQWLINKIRKSQRYKEDMGKLPRDEGDYKYIEYCIWCMENDEFDRLISDYND